MKLLSILAPALLALPAFAAEEPLSSASSAVSSAASAAASAASSAASGASKAAGSASSKLKSKTKSKSVKDLPRKAPDPNDPTPVGQTWSPKWKEADLKSYTRHCASSSTHKAEIYSLGELYPALESWAAELKVFYNKQHYPGSWQGEDTHGEERDLLKMDYSELPFSVREWINKNPKQKYYSVQDDVVFFAPGAMYTQLPLWVDEPEEETIGECEGLFENLENYSAEAKDGAVLATIQHKSLGKNDVSWTIEAFKVQASKEKDEL